MSIEIQNDLISRYELEKRVRKIRVCNNCSGRTQVMYVVSEEDVRKAEAVEAEPVVHAKWEKNKDGELYCDNCGYITSVGRTPGCPRCRAKMYGGNENGRT